MVSESGLGFTWCGNSQIEPADSVAQRSGERSAIRSHLPARRRERRRLDADRAADSREGRLSRAPRPGLHRVRAQQPRHRAGTDRVRAGRREWSGRSGQGVRLRLRNDSGRPRRLTVTYFAEWVLGRYREDQQLHIQTSFDEPSGAILASQSWTGSYTGRPAFAAASPRATSVFRRSHAVPGPE